METLTVSLLIKNLHFSGGCVDKIGLNCSWRDNSLVHSSLALASIGVVSACAALRTLKFGLCAR